MKTPQTLMPVLCLLAASFAGLAPVAAHAACLDDAQIQTLAAHYVAKTPAPTPLGLSAADAACTRGKLNAALAGVRGPLIGYKAGLTNPAVQKRFSTDQPVWGVLYAGMILPNGSRVPAAFGARPLFEADMLVRVKSASISFAKTPMQVLEALDQIIPLIELPDLMVQAPPQLNGPGVEAINVGARLGVQSEPLAVPTLRSERYALLDALRDMKVQVQDGQGALLASGKGSDILEHPLNAVVWLNQALAKQGSSLKPGDIVSLGSFSPLMPPKAGLAVKVTYEGLPGAVPVQVFFE